jgi:hypothetical protein
MKLNTIASSRLYSFWKKCIKNHHSQINSVKAIFPTPIARAFRQNKSTDSGRKNLFLNGDGVEKRAEILAKKTKK